MTPSQQPAPQHCDFEDYPCPFRTSINYGGCTHNGAPGGCPYDSRSRPLPAAHGNHPPMDCLGMAYSTNDDMCQNCPQSEQCEAILKRIEAAYHIGKSEAAAQARADAEQTDNILSVLKKRYRNEMAILDYVEMIECEVRSLRQPKEREQE